MAKPDKPRRGKRIRGGQNTLRLHDRILADINCKVRGVAVHRPGKSNFTATVTDNALLYDCVEEIASDNREIPEHKRTAYGPVVETVETHVVPRMSQTRKQLLNVFPPSVEFERIPTYRVTYQKDKKSGRIVEVKDPIDCFRVVSKGDTTLLNRKPSDEIGTFKREGSVSQGAITRKFTKTIKEQPIEADYAPALAAQPADPNGLPVADFDDYDLD